MQIVIGSVVLCLACVGCDRMVPPENACPPSIIAGPAPGGASGITWGGKLEIASAEIYEVKAECIPNRHAPEESQNFKRGSYTDYEIASTAKVAYKIRDTDAVASKFEASARFEAVSKSGVVLGAAEGSVHIVRGGTYAAVSAKISNLSTEEIAELNVSELGGYTKGDDRLATDAIANVLPTVMWSLQEVNVTQSAIAELRSVGWATELLRRFERNGGFVPQNTPLMFEIRFACELHRRGLQAEYEYAAGVDDSTVDFRVMGRTEWLIELVSVRESQGLQAATTHYGPFWERQLSTDASDPAQSEEGEMIVAMTKVVEKVYSAGRATKFPTPSPSSRHAILVDMRGYLGSGGDVYDYIQIANGVSAIPDSEWATRRFWRGKPIHGLLERVIRHPLKGAVTAQERIHLLGFVAERFYFVGEIEQTAYFRPNPHLLLGTEVQRAAYQSFPLARPTSAA